MPIFNELLKTINIEGHGSAVTAAHVIALGILSFPERADSQKIAL